MIILSFLSIHDEGDKDFDDYFYYWVGVASLAVIMSYWWDVRKEWTLFEPGARYRVNK